MLARCALHDRRAFEALYQQASPTLYGLLLKLWTVALADDGRLHVNNPFWRFSHG